MEQPTVHVMCGLVAAGKTTLARQLARDLPALRLSRDEWMLRLYGLAHDHPVYVAKLPPCTDLMWSLAVDVLNLGSSVVLDWNHWSRDRRAEARRRSHASGCEIVVHFLDVPIETAVERATTRMEAAMPNAHRIDSVGVRHFATIFEAPTADEGLTVIRHG